MFVMHLMKLYLYDIQNIKKETREPTLGKRKVGRNPFLNITLNDLDKKPRKNAYFLRVYFSSANPL